ncbi:glycoside hydrolase family 26 protein [Microbacterium sp. SSM24]|uniref:glycoside hydrolase family 26 protein n=1 Tax=Microbacterium sp. SSM24 TaxID=2991714 RepID=UPI002226D2B6|nr:glycosyl hydrolase [Microbacterium sp. SSM24]MCW3494160.1 glycosyl hydrolase [Microbacterium sp. SSM24]
MSDVTPRTWWAASGRASKLTALGGIVLTVALVATSAVVWASPGGFTPGPSAEDQLAAALAENKALKEDLDAAERAGAAPTPTPTRTPTPTPTPKPTPTPGAKTAPAPEPGTRIVTVYRSSPEGGGEQAVDPAPAPSTPPTSPAVTAPPIASIVAPTQRYFGMYTAQAPFNFATFDDAAVKSGSRQSLVGYFGGWDQAFRGDAVVRSWERGLLPMLTWESRPIAAANDVPEDPVYALPRILDGAFDDYLRTYARDIVATGLPLAIRLNHEMNGTWYPWNEQKTNGSSNNGNRTGDYVAVWRHVHDIFEAEGANAFVIWTWAPNIINNLPDRHQTLEYLRSLYPGDEYVDLVGVSGYLRQPFVAANDFTFDYTFGATLDQLRALTDKPILLAEIAATENGGKKVAWLNSVFASLGEPENADIIGLAWFNIAVTTVSQGQLVTNDWRIDSRGASLAAFRAGLASPAANFRFLAY